MSNNGAVPDERSKYRRLLRNMELVNEATLLSRASLIRHSYDEKRDIDKECRYPLDISVEDYKQAWRRSGLARRVVSVYPDECFALLPELWEKARQKDTTWEKAWKSLNEEVNCLHYLHKADVHSGIGRFGLLYTQYDDGLPLDQPVPEPSGAGRPPKRKLLYLRVFDESSVQIEELVKDRNDPRYGLPELYTVQIVDPEATSKDDVAGNTQDVKVHWTRCVHVCDGGELTGDPRMEDVWNDLLDAKKVRGGSAEMFYKGGFPGYAFTAHDGLSATNLDLPQTQEDLREEFSLYQHGLQRFLTAIGGEWKSLSPQVADPGPHMEQILQQIALAKGVPYRIFVGSEAAHLASTQDISTWNKRVKRRQKTYVEPMILRPFVNRLMRYGVLPRVEKWNVFWPDLDTPTEKDRAEIAAKLTTSLAQYTTGLLRQTVPPIYFFTEVLGWQRETAEVVVAAAEEHLKENPLPPPDPVQAPMKKAGVKPGTRNGTGGRPTGKKSNTKTP